MHIHSGGIGGIWDDNFIEGINMSMAYVYVGSRSEVIGAAIVWTEPKRMEDIHFKE